MLLIGHGRHGVCRKSYQLSGFFRDNVLLMISFEAVSKQEPEDGQMNVDDGVASNVHFYCVNVNTPVLLQ